jgi:hypothetical protein
VLAVFGADYLAPRNLLAAMIPVSALLAVLLAAPQLGRWGALLAALIIAAFLTVSVDVDLSPRLQRGNWRELARALGRAPEARAIATVQLGSAPLEYYLQSVRELGRRSAPRVSEIDLVGYRPLRRSAGRSPASGFTQAARAEVDGLIAYRFTATRPHRVSRSALRAHAITSTRTVALVQRART